MRNDDGSWRRDDERRGNVLIDTACGPELLAGEGVEVSVTSVFGAEQLPTGLAVLIGRRAHRPPRASAAARISRRAHQPPRASAAARISRRAPNAAPLTLPWRCQAAGACVTGRRSPG
jgi:hypothetical protein